MRAEKFLADFPVTGRKTGRRRVNLSDHGRRRQQPWSLKACPLAYRSVKGEPHKIFEGLNLSIKKGEKVALIGSNGAGKSTLMKMMTGLLRPSQGEIEIFGEKIQSVKRDKLFRRISLVYQNPKRCLLKIL